LTVWAWPPVPWGGMNWGSAWSGPLMGLSKDQNPPSDLALSATDAVLNVALRLQLGGTGS